MNPADNRSRTIVFTVVILATTVIVIVGMLTHTISEGLILAVSSSPITAILGFFGGRVTAPPTPPETPTGPTSSPVRLEPFAGPARSPRGEGPSATALATAIRRWWHRPRAGGGHMLGGHA